jgi:hypothetical protein
MAKATTEKKETKKQTPKKTTTKKTPTKSVQKNTTSKTKKTATPVKKETKIIQEENNYSRTIIAAILIAIIFFGGYLAINLKSDGGFGNNKEYVPTKDEKYFKEDYENLNGTNSTDGTKYSEVEIIADNNIKYISMEEAVKILDNGSGVIYFGFATCPYSRSAIPVLLKAMASSKLDTIYYVNLRPADSTRLDGAGQKENDLRDTYTLNAKNKAKKIADAKESYYEALTALANYLDDYILLTDTGKKVNTGEKRILTPTVVSVVNGEIVGFHQETVETQETNEKGELNKLTKEEEKDLLNTYTKIISEYLKAK